MSRSEKVKAPEGTQSIVRCLRLLKKIASGERAASLDELSASQGMAKPTTHRILSALISEGMVRQDPVSKLFSLGPESLSLNSGAVRRADLRLMARPILENLALFSGETATFEVPISEEMFIMDEVQSSHLVGARAELGTRWPMYATSSGKITLAWFDDEELKEYLLRPRKAMTKRTIVSESLLREELERARSDGFAIAEGELQEAFSAVSSAILDRSGRVVATLSVGGPTERLSRSALHRLGSRLWVESQKLTGALGNVR